MWVLGVILALLLAAVIVLLVVLIAHTRRAGEALETFDAKVDTLESNVRADVGAIGQSMHTSAKSIEASLHSSVDAIGDSLSNRFDTFDTGVASRVESMEKKIGSDVERMGLAITGDIDRVAEMMAERLGAVEHTVASQFKGVERALREEFEQSREDNARHNAELLAQLRTAVKGSSDSMTRALDDIAGALRSFEEAQHHRARVSPLVTGGSVAVAVLALLALLIVLLFSRPDDALGRTAALPPLTEVEVASVVSPIPPLADLAQSEPLLDATAPGFILDGDDEVEDDDTSTLQTTTSQAAPERDQPDPVNAEEPGAEAAPAMPGARIAAPIVDPAPMKEPVPVVEPAKRDAPRDEDPKPSVATKPPSPKADESRLEPVRPLPVLPAPTTPQPDPRDLGPEQLQRAFHTSERTLETNLVESLEPIEPIESVEPSPPTPTRRPDTAPVEAPGFVQPDPDPKPAPAAPAPSTPEPRVVEPRVVEPPSRAEPASVETAAWVWGGFASAEEEASAWTVEQCEHHLDIVTRLSHGDYADEVERTLADLAVVRIGDAVVKSLNQRLTDIQASLIEDRSQLEADAFDRADLGASLDAATARLGEIDALIASFIASLPEDRREPWSSHLEGVRRKHGRVSELAGAITTSFDAIASRP